MLFDFGVKSAELSFVRLDNVYLKDIQIEPIYKYEIIL